jgi:hypothetical protein
MNAKNQSRRQSGRRFLSKANAPGISRANPDGVTKLDRDLAELYGVETKTLKQAVRRNINRFPPDFMFEMTEEELENWRSQFVTSKQDRQDLRYAPFCFTEQGATMLSCLLNSARAISVNILIIRVFTKLREMVLSHKDILIKLEQIEKAMLQQDRTMKKHEGEYR